MIHWVFLALIFGVAQGAHALFVKYAGNGISPPAAMLIVNSITFAGAIMVFSAFKLAGQDLTFDRPAALWMVAAGAMVIIFELAFLWMFYNQAPLAAATTAARVFAMLAVVIFAFIFLKEGIALAKIAGIGFALASVYLLSR